MTNPAKPQSLSRRALLQTAAAGALVSGAGIAPARAAGHGPVELNVVLAEVDKPGLKLRTYNGQTPGPTLSALPGEAIEVTVNNLLKAEPPKEFCPEDINIFHASNTTNLHTHGLHVSPEKASDGRDSDNIFLSIVPEGQQVPAKCDSADIRKASADFNFELPRDHPSGTFWYHAHKHGSTAQQVANGLVGPLIVRDRPGDMPSYIENAKEQILMIQMRGLDSDAQEPRQSGGEPQLVLVNEDGKGGGELEPVIELPRGAVRRWRIINAAPRADTFVDLNITNPDGAPALELYQIAYDGITFDRRIPVDTSNDGGPWENPVALAPGNRTDLMIRVPLDAPAGEYRLTADRLDADLLHAAAAIPDGNLKKMTLTIRILDETEEDDWSDNDALPGPGPLLKPINEVDGLRVVRFFLDLSATPLEYLIDGAAFDGEVKQEMKLGTAEQWTVENLNEFTHPFHIHVNPFLVTHINERELPEGDPLRRWQDTVALPPAGSDGSVGSVTMVSRFVRFTGKFVIHCHILEHEDQGMMQAVRVVG